MTAEAKRRSSTRPPPASAGRAARQPRRAGLRVARRGRGKRSAALSRGLLGDAPPAPPLSEPDAVADRVVAYVSQGDRFSFSTERAAPAAGARAAAVIRALNRQRVGRRLYRTRCGSGLWRGCASRAWTPARGRTTCEAPAGLAMLAQTFYVDHGEGARDQRLYLGDLLAQHETWASAQHVFWERSLTRRAVLGLGYRTPRRLEGDRHGDLLFSSGAQDAARRVHLCVHAQLAAFCVSMKAPGAPLAEIRRHAVRCLLHLQYAGRRRRVLLREYDDPREKGSQSHVTCTTCATPSGFVT